MPTAQQKPYPPYQRNLLAYMLLALLVVVAYLANQGREQEGRFDIAYSRFKALVAADQVERVVLRGHVIDGTALNDLPLGPQEERGRLFRTRVPEVGDAELLGLLESHEVEIEVRAEDEGAGLWPIVVGLLPWILFLGLFYFLIWRGAKSLGGRIGGPGDVKRFLESSTRKAEVPNVTFGDLAGQEHAKREVQEVVEFLKNPDKFRRLGADVPKGVLLMGPPGTGKTLMARALAGEAGVPFFSISGSEFIEVFVGVGAARVRNLFQTAKQNAPAIIFIDELDSVGRTRGTGLGGGHDEREQTLNQILAEMDGFEGHEAVIVIAATNRPDVLDPALLRPGRFDRHVTLDLPDRREREAILKVHTRNVPIAREVSLLDIAAGTPGFSGADIRNLVNEAAMRAAAAGKSEVAQEDFDEARDKLLLGTVRTLAIQPQERHRLAVHEAGHTLAAYFLPEADPLYKVTIIPRGRTLGGTQMLPEVERYTLPEGYLKDQLAVILAGRTAERQLLGSVSSGADDDIARATQLARAMVSRWGMADEIGPVDLRESEAHPFLGKEIAQPRRFSEHSAKAVDEAVGRLLRDAERRDIELLEAHREGLEALVARLEQEETLGAAEIEDCLGPGPEKPQFKIVASRR